MLSTSTSTVKTQSLKVKRCASKPEPESKTTQVLPETQGQDKLEEFNQTNDYWQRRSYYESTAGSIEGLSANASKPAHPATENINALSDSMLEDVITEVKKVEGKNNNEGAEIVDDVINNVCKDISNKHTNETSQGEDGEKREEKGNKKKPA
ncbi:hypothetical protein L1987_30481 [Smallanthus sonchifolius]|uniref:Uncharacterized protein n=1 Tax=Smallanthus sonchifolius TaxID=185202 RepID=A0ACB9I2Y4_9ASTR|nr:hypothetical protein L1987_30481 [Smallanthus sonchifolius]